VAVQGTVHSATLLTVKPGGTLVTLVLHQACCGISRRFEVAAGIAVLVLLVAVAMIRVRAVT
jgi:hypothetical protein